MLYLNDTAAASVGIFVEHRPTRPVPRRKMLSWDIPGRSGKLYRELDGFENIQLEYELAVVPLPGIGLGDTVDLAVSWLNQGGEMQLRDDCDPSVFYLVRYHGGSSLAPILHSARRAKISFDADPRRWLLSGEEPVTISAGQSVTLSNPTAYAAPPLIRIFGTSGSALPGTLTVGAASVSFPDGRVLSIDCDRHSAYAPVSLTSNVWPSLAPGETTVSLTGSGLSADIYPRWFVV